VADVIDSVFGFVTLGCFGTYVGSKFLVTLGFVLPHHFIKCMANERASRVEHPVAVGATEALKFLALNPNQLA